MKKIRIMYMENCPYCVHAHNAIAALMAEEPKYNDLYIEWLEESHDNAKIQEFGQSYYYVPTIFVDKTKMYEAQPGDTYEFIYNKIKEIFDSI